LLEQAWELARKRPGPVAGSHAWLLMTLAETYDQAGRFADSEPLYREALEAARKRDGEDSPQAAGALAYLGLSLLRQRKYAEAEPLLRECLKVRAQKEPDDWRTFNTKSLLGASLLGQKKFDEAEPLLLAGYEGMKLREGKVRAQGKVRLTEASERLVQLYDAWGRKDKADEWRRKLTDAESAKPAETRNDGSP
jgi:tetratricopeptide (TPR) repeat protein